MNSAKALKNKKYLLVIFPAMLIIVIIVLFFHSSLYKVARYELGSKNNYKISIHFMAPGITSISANQRNKTIFEALVTDPHGNPVPFARINFNEKNGLGSFSYLAKRTSGSGTLMAVYTPPDEALCLKTVSTAVITITARLVGTSTESSLTLKLVRTPVVFVHGYKASPSIFSNFRDYLETSGFLTAGLDYNSGKGVASGAVQLEDFLDRLTGEYAKKGIQAYNFDIIAHSMGGLVSRYYTCSPDYSTKNNINKIVFVSVPQKGSPFASLGLKYYKDRGIYDLMPDSELFTKTFPSMINGGLNNTVRSASILGQYDEVVSRDSASLDKWGIETEIFEVGKSNFTVDKLLTGKIVEAANHKLVLDNLKVFRRVEEMLLSDLPYPQKIR